MRRDPPKMGRELAAAAAVALLLGGCGGTRHAAPPRPPALPRALASDLASASDEVAAALASGDSCRALTLVHGLQAQTIAAINAHRVPAGLQEQLSGSVNSLAARVSCVPPPDNRGKHKDHEKHGKKKKKDEGD